MSIIEKIVTAICGIVILAVFCITAWEGGKTDVLKDYCEYNNGEYIYLQYASNPLKTLEVDGVCLIDKNLIEIDFIE